MFYATILVHINDPRLDGNISLVFLLWILNQDLFLVLGHGEVIAARLDLFEQSKSIAWRSVAWRYVP